MLSLPLIAPQNEYTLFLTPHLRPSHNHSHTQHDPSNPQNQHRRPNSSGQQHAHRAQSRHSLAQLQSDENAIAQRKHNIRHFGAGWIKPPGVSRTLQAELEERAEREEQAAVERREQMLADMRAQQELEEARARAEEGGNEEEEEGERDLDDEIPDAIEDEDEEEEVSEDLSEEMDSADESLADDDNSSPAPAYRGQISPGGLRLHDLQLPQHSLLMEEDDDGVPAGPLSPPEAGEMTFNDDSLLEGSFLPSDSERDRVMQERYARLEEAELTGVARDEADLGIERDLDDSVPEAGEYQHTDTELEESTSEEEGASDVGEESAEGISEVRPSRRSSERASIGGRSSGGRWSVTSRRSLRAAGGGLRERQIRTSGSERSLRSRDISSLLESSFMDSSPVVGRLRSGNFRGHGGGQGGSRR